MITSLQLTPTNAWAAYRLGVGDVLEIAVVGSPDLRYKTAVNIDGEIVFPLIGSLKVIGLSLLEVRNALGSALSTKMVRMRAADTRDSVSAITPEEVLVNIVEYRPIYLDGDISKPGEQAYRPNMTVRQAISAAGGYDITRFRMSNPVLELVDLRSQYEVFRSEIIQKEARVARLQAELDSKATFELKILPQSSTESVPLPQVRNFEAELLNARKVDHDREKSYLNNAIKQADARLSTLNAQQQQEGEGVRLDVAEFERVKGLLDKGQGTVIRVTDARRALLLSSTRQLQTSALATQVEVQRDELSRRLQKLDDDRHMNIMNELQTTSMELDAARSRLRAAQEKIVYVGTVRSELVRGTGGNPEIVVFRMGADGEEQITAGQDMLLKPGDIVQITLKSEPSER
ncbi:polysaccharide biosynthesis/export family protein [Microvirga aerophila]|uniref:polysaccharide biosynthesis/export family protein n=1 Tax=Microvirga aerophila TaxID=670291 RepID=UPI001FE02E6E|nr:polysaccharide biosynthesis/export family protein [Microvirga aerophila]